MNKAIKKIAHSFGASLFGQILLIVTQFLTVPFYIEAWGVELYGEWLVINTLQVYFGLFDFGLMSVAANDIAMKFGGNEKKEALGTYQTAWVFIALISCITILAGIIISTSKVGWFFNLELIQGYEFVILTQLFVATTILQFMIGMSLIGMRCTGNNPTSIWITNVFSSIQLIVIVLSLRYEVTCVSMAIELAIIKLLNLLFLLYILNKLEPWLYIGVAEYKFSTLKKMFRPSIYFMGFPLSNALRNQGVMSMISMQLGPASVASYYVMRTLINSTQQFLNAVNSSAWTEISIEYGCRNIRTLKAIYRMMMTVAITIAVIASICLALFGEAFISYWTRGLSDFNGGFFNVMIVAGLFTSIWYSGSVLLSATSKHEKMSLFCLIISILSLASCYVYMNHSLFNLGIILLFGEVVVSIYVIQSNTKFLKSLGDNIHIRNLNASNKEI